MYVLLAADIIATFYDSGG